MVDVTLAFEAGTMGSNPITNSPAHQLGCFQIFDATLAGVASPFRGVAQSG